MYESDLKVILSLLKDKENGAWYISEIYHALLEYIRYGEAISDMGHPDFHLGASGNIHGTYHSNYSPSSTIFQLASACSNYLNNFDTELIWYRDLSTWEKFCKFVVELKQIKYFKRNFRKAIKSYKYYIGRIECPACGSVRNNYKFDRTDEVYLEDKDNLVFVNCRRCGKYIISHGSFKYLDSFEKKAKLYVFLSTRADRNNEYELKITPKILKEIIM